MSAKLSLSTAAQLAIYIEHRPGALARVCEELAKAKINIEALGTEGATSGARGDEMLVRMVVSDSPKALKLLNEMGAVAVQTDVLLIEGGNQPGMLAKVAERLAKSEINIESVYLSSSADASKCVIILRPSNVEQAMRALRGL